MKEFLRGMTATSWALVALLALCLLTFSWCSYDSSRNRREDEARVAANARAADRNTGAVGQAAEERVADTLNTAAQKQELSDAVAQLPDAVPSARRIALACERLRQQGTRDPNLPAVCRSAGAAKASPRP